MKFKTFRKGEILYDKETSPQVFWVWVTWCYMKLYYTGNKLHHVIKFCKYKYCINTKYNWLLCITALHHNNATVLHIDAIWWQGIGSSPVSELDTNFLQRITQESLLQNSGVPSQSQGNNQSFVNIQCKCNTKKCIRILYQELLNFTKAF